jgi:hypothetical protein
MSKGNKDFYEEPQPQLYDEDATGITLGFYANGRNISDYRLERSDIEFLAEEFGKWLSKHKKDEAV